MVKQINDNDVEVHDCIFQGNFIKAKLNLRFPCSFFIEWRSLNGKQLILSANKYKAKNGIVEFNDTLSFSTEMLWDKREKTYLKKDSIVKVNLVSASRPDQIKLVGQLNFDLAEASNSVNKQIEGSRKLAYCSVDAELMFEIKVIEIRRSDKQLGDLDKSTFNIEAYTITTGTKANDRSRSRSQESREIIERIKSQTKLREKEQVYSGSAIESLKNGGSKGSGVGNGQQGSLMNEVTSPRSVSSSNYGVSRVDNAKVVSSETWRVPDSSTSIQVGNDLILVEDQRSRSPRNMNQEYGNQQYQSNRNAFTPNPLPVSPSLRSNNMMRNEPTSNIDLSNLPSRQLTQISQPQAINQPAIDIMRQNTTLKQQFIKSQAKVQILEQQIKNLMKQLQQARIKRQVQKIEKQYKEKALLQTKIEEIQGKLKYKETELSIKSQQIQQLYTKLDEVSKDVKKKENQLKEFVVKATELQIKLQEQRNLHAKEVEVQSQILKEKEEKISELVQSLSEANSIRESVQTKNKEFQVQLQEKDLQKVKAMEQECNAKLLEAERMYGEISKRVQQLQLKNKELKDKLSLTQSKNTELLIIQQGLQQRNNETLGQVQQLTLQKQSLQAQIRRKDERLFNFEEMFNQKVDSTKVTEMQIQVQKLSQQKALIEEELNGAKVMIQNQRKVNEELTEKINQLNQRLGYKVNGVSAQVISLQSQLQQKTAQIQILKGEIQLLQIQNTRLKSQHDISTKPLDTAQETPQTSPQSQALKTQLRALSQQLQTIQKQLAVSHQENFKLQMKLMQYENTIQQKNQQILTLNQQLSNIHKNPAQNTANIVDQNIMIEQLNAKVTETQVINTQLSQELKVLKLQIQQSKKNIPVEKPNITQTPKQSQQNLAQFNLQRLQAKYRQQYEDMVQQYEAQIQTLKNQFQQFANEVEAYKVEVQQGSGKQADGLKEEDHAKDEGVIAVKTKMSGEDISGDKDQQAIVNEEHSQISSLKQQITTAMTRIDQYQIKVTQLQNQLKRSKQQIQLLTNNQICPQFNQVPYKEEPQHVDNMDVDLLNIKEKSAIEDPTVSRLNIKIKVNEVASVDQSHHSQDHQYILTQEDYLPHKVQFKMSSSDFKSPSQKQDLDLSLQQQRNNPKEQATRKRSQQMKGNSEQIPHSKQKKMVPLEQVQQMISQIAQEQQQVRNSAISLNQQFEQKQVQLTKLQQVISTLQQKVSQQQKLIIQLTHQATELRSQLDKKQNQLALTQKKLNSMTQSINTQQFTSQSQHQSLLAKITQLQDDIRIKDEILAQLQSEAKQAYGLKYQLAEMLDVKAELEQSAKVKDQRINELEEQVIQLNRNIEVGLKGNQQQPTKPPPTQYPQLQQLKTQLMHLTQQNQSLRSQLQSTKLNHQLQSANYKYQLQSCKHLGKSPVDNLQLQLTQCQQTLKLVQQQNMQILDQNNQLKRQITLLTEDLALGRQQLTQAQEQYISYKQLTLKLEQQLNQLKQINASLQSQAKRFLEKTVVLGQDNLMLKQQLEFHQHSSQIKQRKNSLSLSSTNKLLALDLPDIEEIPQKNQSDYHSETVTHQESGINVGAQQLPIIQQQPQKQLLDDNALKTIAEVQPQPSQQNQGQLNDIRMQLQILRQQLINQTKQHMNLKQLYKQLQEETVMKNTEPLQTNDTSSTLQHLKVQHQRLKLMNNELSQAVKQGQKKIASLQRQLASITKEYQDYRDIYQNEVNSWVIAREEGYSRKQSQPVDNAGGLSNLSQQEYSTIKKSLQEKDKTLSQKNSIIDQNTKLIQQKDNIISSKDNLIKEKSNIISETQLKLTEANKKIRELNSLVEQFNDRILEIQEQNLVLQKQRSDLIDETSVHSTLLKQSEDEIKMLREQVAGLEQQVQGSISEVSANQEQVLQLKFEIDRLHQEKTALQDTLKNQDTVSSKTLEAVQIANSQLQAQIQYLNHEKQQIMQQIQQLTTQLQSQKLHYQEQLQLKSTQLQTTHQQLQELQSDLTSLKTQLTSTTLQLQTVTLQNQHLKESLNHTTTTSSKHQSQKSSLQQRILELQTQLQKLKSSQLDLEQQYFKQVLLVDQMTQKNLSLVLVIEKHQAKENVMRDHLNMLQEESKNIFAIVKEKEIQVDSLYGLINQLETQNSSLKDQIVRLEEIVYTKDNLLTYYQNQNALQKMSNSKNSKLNENDSKQLPKAQGSSTPIKATSSIQIGLMSNKTKEKTTVNNAEDKVQPHSSSKLSEISHFGAKEFNHEPSDDKDQQIRLLILKNEEILSKNKQYLQILSKKASVAVQSQKLKRTLQKVQTQVKTLKQQLQKTKKQSAESIADKTQAILKLQSDINRMTQQLQIHQIKSDLNQKVNSVKTKDGVSLDVMKGILVEKNKEIQAQRDMIKSKTNEVQQLKVQNKEMEGQVVELRKSVNGLSLEIAGLKAKQAHLESSLQASSVKGSSPSNVAQDTKIQVRNISTPALNLNEARNPASNKPTSDKTQALSKGQAFTSTSPKSNSGPSLTQIRKITVLLNELITNKSMGSEQQKIIQTLKNKHAELDQILQNSSSLTGNTINKLQENSRSISKQLQKIKSAILKSSVKTMQEKSRIICNMKDCEHNLLEFIKELQKINSARQ